MIKFYSMVDANGYIVRSQYTDNAEAAVSDGCRLLPDSTPEPLPTVHTVNTEYWQRVEPVPNTATAIEYVRVQRPLNEIAEEMRNIRNAYLQQSDWTMLMRSSLTENQIEQWAIYRQELRDITNQAGFPLQPVFPEEP